MEKNCINKVRTRWWALLLTTMALVLPGTIHAEDWLNNKANYVVRSEGSGVIRIEVPVYDQDGSDSWVSNAKIVVQPQGMNKEDEFLNWFVNETDIPQDRKYVSASFRTNAYGEVTLVRSENSSYPETDVLLTKGSYSKNKIYCNGQTQRMLAVIKWKVPQEYRDKTLKFNFQVTYKGNNNIYGTVLTSSSVDLMAPSTMLPIVTEGLWDEDSK